MPFRYPHIHEPVGIYIPESLESRAVRHGSRYGDHLVVSRSQLNHDCREDIRIRCLACILLRQSRLYLEWPRAVESGRMPLGGSVSLSLLGAHMDDDGVLDVLGLFYRLLHGGDIMPVHGSQIGDPHILEEHPRDYELLHGALYPLKGIHHLLSPPRHALFQEHLEPGFEVLVAHCSPYALQIFGHAAHILGDRHGVVVQYDDIVRAQLRGVVQPFIGQSARQRSVSYHRDHGIVLFLQIPCLHESQSHRDRRAGVPRIEGIAVTLPSLREAAHAAVLAQGVEALFPAGEQLVDIGLMPHIEDYLVLGQVQLSVECHRQLHHSQIAAQMASCTADLLDQEFPDLSGEPRQLLSGYLLYVVWFLYTVQQHISTPVRSWI